MIVWVLAIHGERSSRTLSSERAARDLFEERWPGFTPILATLEDLYGAGNVDPDLAPALIICAGIPSDRIPAGFVVQAYVLGLCNDPACGPHCNHFDKELWSDIRDGRKARHPIPFEGHN